MDFLDENEENGKEYLEGWVDNKSLGSILQICSIWGVDLRGGEELAPPPSPLCARGRNLSVLSGLRRGRAVLSYSVE